VVFVVSAFVGSLLCAQLQTTPIVPVIESEKATAETKSTLGSKAPEGAVVLFNGSNFDAWKPFSFWVVNQKDNQKQVQWKLVDGNAMEVSSEFEGGRRKQWLCTREKFGDYRLHLEFRIPEEGGSNAGLFFGPLYELQILDSANKKKIGLGDCGALYQLKRPDVNAALPRGQWQTYDLVYQHAKIGEHGKMTETGAAKLSAWLNGKLIHDDIHLSLRRNKYGAYPEEATSRIILQDHDAQVQFRNIWIQESKNSPVKQLLKQIQNLQKKPASQLTLPKKRK